MVEKKRLLNIRKSVSLVAVVVLAHCAIGQADYGALLLGAKVGTNGFGAVAGIDLSKRVSVRGQTSFLRISDPLDDIVGGESEIELEVKNYAAILDWHPFVNGVKVSVGLFANRNRLSFSTDIDELTFGDVDYFGNLGAEMGFRSIAPYFGVGFSSGRGRAGFGFNVDLGFLSQGEPELSASGAVFDKGGVSEIRCSFRIDADSVATDQSSTCRALFPNLQQDLETERKDIEDVDASGNLDFYPVAEIGLTYRF